MRVLKFQVSEFLFWVITQPYYIYASVQWVYVQTNIMFVCFTNKSYVIYSPYLSMYF